MKELKENINPQDLQITKHQEAIRIPSEDDIMELGTALSIGEENQVEELKKKMAQEILNSLRGDRGDAGKVYVIEKVDAKLEGKNIILSIKCENVDDPVKIQLPYSQKN